MTWNPLSLFFPHGKTNNNGANKNTAETDVVISQLFENGPMVEVIEFFSAPPDKKRKKADKRKINISRKKEARKEPFSKKSE